MCTSYNTAHKLPSVTSAVFGVFAGSPSHQSISEWRMQSIARDSEDSTDDEFFDAHGKIISSPLPPAVQKSTYPQYERSREVCTDYLVTKQYSVRKPWPTPPHGNKLPDVSFIYTPSDLESETCSRFEVCLSHLRLWFVLRGWLFWHVEVFQSIYISAVCLAEDFSDNEEMFAKEMTKWSSNDLMDKIETIEVDEAQGRRCFSVGNSLTYAQKKSYLCTFVCFHRDAVSGVGWRVRWDE